MRKRRFHAETILLTMTAVMTVFIYSNALDGPFVFDDYRNILENRHIRLKTFEADGIMDAALESPLANRPVSYLSFALSYRLHGYNAVGFRVLNLLIHLTSGLLLYFLLKATFAMPAVAARYPNGFWIPFFSAAIWLVHPLQTQSVSYIVQRMNSLAGLFFVACMLFYVTARRSDSRLRRSGLFAGCGLPGIIALGTKEIAATLPVFILLYELYFFQNLDLSFFRRHRFKLAVLTAVLLLASLVYLGGDPLGRITGSYAKRDFTLIQRLLTEPRIVVQYMSLTLLPHPSRLNLDHDVPVSRSLFEPWTTIPALLVIGALVFLAVRSARRDPLISFAVLWFFGNLAIESSFIGLELMFEHRTYIPLMFAIPIPVALAFRYIRPKWVCIGLLGVVTVLCAWWAHQRNVVWSDAVLLWQDAASKSPNEVRPLINLGSNLADRGDLKAAVEQFQRAIHLKPDSAEAHQNLGFVYIKLGNLQQGIVQFNRALAIRPDNSLTHNNLGLAYMLSGNLRAAETHLLRAIDIKPDYEAAYNNLGLVYRRRGELDNAIRCLKKALEIDPDYAEAHNNLGYALMLEGDLKGARHHFLEALRIVPQYGLAQKNLEEVETLLDKTRRAD